MTKKETYYRIPETGDGVTKQDTDDGMTGHGIRKDENQRLDDNDDEMKGYKMINTTRRGDDAKTG